MHGNPPGRDGEAMRNFQHRTVVWLHNGLIGSIMFAPTKIGAGLKCYDLCNYKSFIIFPP